MQGLTRGKKITNPEVSGIRLKNCDQLYKGFNQAKESNLESVVAKIV